MAVAACVQPDRKLGLVTFSGVVDAEDIAKAVRGIYEHPSWGRGFDVIWDATRIRALHLGPDDIERVVGLVTDFQRVGPPGREAVATTREVDFMVARLFIERMRRWRAHEVRICATVDEAADWLGLGTTELARARADCGGDRGRSQPVKRGSSVREAA